MTITAAADGSALGNPGPNGWAWYIDDDNWAAGGSPHGTNNQGELQAVLELLRATAGTDEKLVIECDSKYVIDSITKWMPGWKRKGWRKSDGSPVLNRELMEALDQAMQGRDVRFEWVKGHAGHPLNEAADERANGAAKAYQQKKEPNRGPGFTGALGPSTGSGTQTVPTSGPSTGSGAQTVPTSGPSTGSGTQTVPTSGPPTSSGTQTVPTSGPSTGSGAQTVDPTPWVAEPVEAPQPLWAETADLLDALDAPASAPVSLTVTLTADEHARLADRAEAQRISLEEALRRLI